MGSSPTPGTDNEVLAFIVGIALGDGNLSNPNKRAVRLRITCDAAYPNIINTISSSLEIVCPKNKVSIRRRKERCVDISCYSNQWEERLGWTVKGGSKFNQQVHIPDWVKRNDRYSIACLRGLFLTDGSIYSDRGYQMANFTTIIEPLAVDVTELLKNFGFVSHCYRIENKVAHRQAKFVIRISKNVDGFISLLQLYKT